RVDSGGVGEDGDDGLGVAGELRRRGGGRGAGSDHWLQFVGGAGPRRHLVSNLDEPVRDGRAHFAGSGYFGLRRMCSPSPSGRSPTPPQRSGSGRRPYGIMRARERQSLRASPRGHIELERGSARRVASSTGNYIRSSPRKRGPRPQIPSRRLWIPACAGMSGQSALGGWQWRKAKSVSSASGSWAARSRVTSSPPVGGGGATTSMPHAAAPGREPASRSQTMRKRSPARSAPSSPASLSPPRSMRR